MDGLINKPSFVSLYLNFVNGIRIEIVGFCDSCVKTYVLYARTICSDNILTCQEVLILWKWYHDFMVLKGCQIKISFILQHL